MNPRYLLDTNVLSDLVRNPQGLVAGRIAEVGESAVCTSVIVAAELRFGARKRESKRLTLQVEAILSAITVCPLEEPADHWYARLRTELERQGNIIGPNDMLIAAHALTLDCIVVTVKQTEFARLPGLRMENWLAA